MKNRLSLLFGFMIAVKRILILIVNKKISVINIRWIFSNSPVLYSYMENIQTLTHYLACYGAFPISPFH